MGVEFTNKGVQVSNDGGIDGYGYHVDADDLEQPEWLFSVKDLIQIQWVSRISINFLGRWTNIKPIIEYLLLIADLPIRQERLREKVRR